MHYQQRFVCPRSQYLLGVFMQWNDKQQLAGWTHACLMQIEQTDSAS